MSARAPRTLALLVLSAAAFAAAPALSAAAAFTAGPVPSVTNVNTDSLPPAARIRVITYNMLHGFGNALNDETLDARLALLAAALLREQPDVVILQEASMSRRHGNVVDRLRDMLNTGGGTDVTYNSAMVMANGSALIGFFEGSAVLSRARIVSAESLVYKAQALLPPERRVALRVLIAGAASNLEVIGTHLTNTEARGAAGLKRTLQARELAAWAATGPPASAVIVAGDFNDSPGSATVQALREAGGHDAWADAVESGGALGTGLTSLNGTVRDPGDVADERIDYLFVFGRDAGPLAVVKDAALFLDAALPDSKGIPLWASDHIGVRVDLSLP